MDLTQKDIDDAVMILRKYRTAAVAKKNDTARQEVELLMRVLDALYKGGKV